MSFIWRDYNPDNMHFVENWLDENAVICTGLDEGFRDFYEYWKSEDGFDVGKNFWCKVIYEENRPFAVIAFCLYESSIKIMEALVAPEKRGLGKGTALLKELLSNDEIMGCAIHTYEAIIYHDNAASKKAFDNAGFVYQSNQIDENGQSMLYVYEKSE